MSNAALFAEAVDAVVALYRALAVWLLIAAMVCALLSLAVVVGVAYAAKAARRWLYARLSDEDAPQASEPRPPVKRPHTPAWAHQQPTRYEEAA
ncbi:hypothetical protein ACH4ZX_03715 [Streptomyces sp. NPDC020490]|uniref:hypothetical protein n=1 Tax=Streptomyces sp. NPDC020490 TaxID=3365078 RepID=UPI00379AE1F5